MSPAPLFPLKLPENHFLSIKFNSIQNSENQKSFNKLNRVASLDTKRWLRRRSAAAFRNSSAFRLQQLDNAISATEKSSTSTYFEISHKMDSDNEADPRMTKP